MANRIQCPLCGRNTRLSNIARKVVRHRQRREVHEPHYDLNTRNTVLIRVMREGDVCPVSGLKEGEVRRLRRTLEAFRGH